MTFNTMLALHALFGDAKRGTWGGGRAAAVGWLAPTHPERSPPANACVPLHAHERDPPRGCTGLEVYQALRRFGLTPDAFTVVSLLKVFRNDGLHHQAFRVSSLLLGARMAGSRRT